MKTRLGYFLFAASLTLTGCGGSSDFHFGSINTPIGTPPVVDVDDDGNTQVNLSNLETLLTTYSIGTLNDSEQAGLLLMREEEKLAHDVYLSLYNLHNLPIFGNISDSEATHAEAVKLLLERYNLTDPVDGMMAGEFATNEMQALYDNWVYQGTPTLVDALTVGALIEELDIYDIERLKEDIMDNDDIELVYENLQKGSRNHLRSFYNQLLNNGETYTPAYLTQEEFDEIVNSDIERGSN